VPLKKPKTAVTKAPLFEIRASPIAGLGAFALRRIRAGRRIIEYLGRRISTEEADAQYDDDGMNQHHTVLFSVDDDTVIDASVDGNEARFINHACAPNCQAVNEDGRIFIEALEDIEPGAELVYDYSLTRDEPWDPRWAKLYACHCGAPSCRGILLTSPKPPARKKAVAKKKTTSAARNVKRATARGR
jgi:hypothetical protein